MNKSGTPEKPNTAVRLPNQAHTNPRDKTQGRKSSGKKVSQARAPSTPIAAQAEDHSTAAVAQETTELAKVSPTLSDREYLNRELSRRELARRSYRRYLYYVHGVTWKRTRMSDYLADTVQQFVEADTRAPLRRAAD